MISWNKFALVFTLPFFLFWAAACSSNSTSTTFLPPTNTKVAEITNTPTPLPPTWTPTSTLSPTATQIPTPVNTPTPEIRATNTAQSRLNYYCNRITDIALASDETGWAVVKCGASVGNRALTTGYVYHLEDGEWQLVTDAPDIAGPYSCYTAISAVNNNEMWAVGLRGGVYVCQEGNWLLHYLDGQWEVVNVDDLFDTLSSPHRTGLHSIEMIDSRNGWVGGKGVILRYEDGIWSVELELPTNYNSGFDNIVDAINMSSLDAGWAWVWSYSGSYFFRYQGNSWVRWQDFTFDNDSFVTDIDTINANEAWAVGHKRVSETQFSPRLWRFFDGYWQEIELPIEEGLLSSIKMFNDNEGWITGGFGAVAAKSIVLYYTNGQWQSVASPTDAGISSMDAITPNSVWIGADKFYHYLPSNGWRPVDIISTIE